ncbi:MAG: VOC family protein [Acidobacteria bacterium]|nr:VOC family protein [Acidobacteriota bacterium]
MRKLVLCLLSVWLATPGSPGVPQGTTGELPKPLIAGIDHIPLAVRDLSQAAAQFRSLGFVLKEGRAHENGILNRHAKFPDGSELELITAPNARDALTAEYRTFLSRGNGPAYLGFFAPDQDRLVAELAKSGQRCERDGGMIGFPAGDALHHIFFAHRSASPTDRPEHFLHPNTAEALIGVWLATDDLSPERGLLRSLGIPVERRMACTPECAMAEVAQLPEGEIVLLPGRRQVVPGRRIAGATVRVRSVAAARTALERGGWKTRVRRSRQGSSIFLPPEVCFGLWLELRQVN